MSLEDFQSLDNEPLDNSIIKRDSTKIYHRQGDQLNQSDQNIELIFGENNNYHQIGNAYLEFNITVQKNDTTSFHDNDPIRLVKNALAFCFKHARLTTSICGDIEINKFCGPISTIMRYQMSTKGVIRFICIYMYLIQYPLLKLKYCSMKRLKIITRYLMMNGI